MPAEFTAESSLNDHQVVVTVSGEIDLSTAPALAQCLIRASRLGNELVVNLEGVEFMDCSGLRALLRWAGDDAERGPRVLTVTPGPPQVQRLFELTGAGQFLRVVSPASLDERPAA